jgi:hypothetical protein
MNSAGDALNVMRSLIGTREDPDGSNNAPRSPRGTRW